MFDHLLESVAYVIKKRKKCLSILPKDHKFVLVKALTAKPMVSEQTVR